MKIDLSVIICTYNRDKYIAESITAIVNQIFDYPTCELLVINNNSTDQTDSICTNLLQSGFQFRYIIETTQGLSAARNRGIQEANGEILVFIDDDAMAREHFLKNILAMYQKYPEMAASGGRIYPRFESKKPAWMSRFLVPLMSVIDKGNAVIPFKGSHYPIGANMAFRKEIIHEIGLFDTTLGRSGGNLQGGEEKDIFNRIKAKGKAIYYLPDVEVDHVIPDARLEKSFICKMGFGIGSSEQIRARNIGNSELLKAHMKECMKWAASGILFLFYLLSLSPSKGWMILRFRYWVSKGMFSKIN